MALTTQQGKLVLVNTENKRVSFPIVNNVLSTTGTISAPTNVVTSNLLSWWKLEESSLSPGGVLDSAFSLTGTGSNPANNGTRFGTAPISDSGISGNCASFSGDDYITVQNESNFDFDRLSPFSLSAWVNVTSLSGQRRILVKMTGGFVGWDWCISNSGPGNQRFGLHGGPTNGTNEIDVMSSGSKVQLNQWTHVAVTYSGSGSLSGVKFYYNGVLQSTVDNSGGATLTTTTLNNSAVQIGINQDLAGEPWAGYLDEVMVYGAELTAAQVLQNYQYFTRQIVTSGLVSWWKFGGNLNDSAYADTGVGDNPGNTGTQTVGSETYVTSQYGFEPPIGQNGYTTNGSFPSASTIRVGGVGTPPANVQTNTFTWEWRWNHVNSFSGGGGSYSLLLHNGGASGNGLIIEEALTTGNLNVSLRTTGSSTFSSQAIVPGVNEYWSVSYDGAHVKVYRDGKLVDTFAKTGNVNYDNTGAGLFFFSRGDGITGLDAGTQVDFIRMYNRALSDNEIFNNFLNSTPSVVSDGMTAWWKFNGDTTDSGPNKIATTLVGTEIYVDAPGNLGQAMQFDGTTYLKYQNGATRSAHVTYDLWVNHTNLAGVDQYGSNYGDSFVGTANDAPALFHDFDPSNHSTGQAPYPSLAPRINTGSGQQILAYFPNHGVRYVVNGTEDGTLHATFGTEVLASWNHVVISYDGTYIKMFVNKVLRAIITSATGNISHDNSSPFQTIGATGAGVSKLIGKIASFKTYNRALTDGGVTTLGNTATGEVAQNYSAEGGK